MSSRFRGKAKVKSSLAPIGTMSPWQVKPVTSKHKACLYVQ